MRRSNSVSNSVSASVSVSGRTRLAMVLVGALIVAGVTVAAAPGAGATTIAVSGTSDGGPGSLRAAIDAANSASSPTTIVLVAGATYDLTVCDGTGNQEDLNGSGDLDVVAGQNVTIKGRGATIRQTCPHDDRERVLDLRGSASVAIDRVIVTGGYLGGPSDTAASGTGGGIRSISPLTLDQVTIDHNSAGTAGGLWTDHALTLRGSTVSNNVAAYVGGGVIGTGGTTIDRTTIEGNQALNAGGLGTRSSLVMRMSRVVDNHSVDGVAGMIVTSGTATIDRSTVADNTTDGDVGGLGVQGLTSQPTSATVTNSTISGNRARNAAGIAFQGASLVLDDSTVADNHATQAMGGIGGVVGGSLEARSSTVTGNEAPVAANLATLQTDPSDPASETSVSLFGTVIADGIGGSNCATVSAATATEVGPLTPTRTGYDYDTDGTCGLGGGVGDVSAGTDPRLSSLAAHGGPTLTRQPLRGSPLLDAVPTADPSCTGPDQRGRSRPSGAGCDIGSVEARART